MKFTTTAITLTALASATTVAADICIPYDNPVCHKLQAEGLKCEILDGWANCHDYAWGLYYQLEEAAPMVADDRERFQAKKTAARDLLEYIRAHYW